jgi:hypothetical protein
MQVLIGENKLKQPKQLLQTLLEWKEEEVEEVPVDQPYQNLEVQHLHRRLVSLQKYQPQQEQKLEPQQLHLLQKPRRRR